MHDESVGVYIHVPFCERVCPYCDFAVVGGVLAPSTEERYVAAVCAELAQRARDFSGLALASVYLGGGTPSLLRPESVARLLDSVREHFSNAPNEAAGAQKNRKNRVPGNHSGNRSRGTEVTLEVNPSTVERERLRAFLQAGVNRLSVGIQSFDNRVLQRLGRAHRAEDGHQTLEAARRAGFDNISLDLIFAAPGQSLGDLTADLDAAIRWEPEHVSTYELTVEDGTPFALADQRGQLSRASQDEAAGMLEQIESRLQMAGIERYELSNHARPGREAVHNRRYWERAPVLGLGMGAWSSDPANAGAPHGSRRMNPRVLGVYLERVEAGQAAAREIEVHDAATARSEAVFLALRCRAGLSAARFSEWFGSPPRAFFSEAIDGLVAEGLLGEGPQGDLVLEGRGWLLSDLVCERFV